MTKPGDFRPLLWLQTIKRLFGDCPFARYTWHIGRHPSLIPGPAVILFPCRDTVLGCGIAGMVAVKPVTPVPFQMPALKEMTGHVENQGLGAFEGRHQEIADGYLGGDAPLMALGAEVQQLKTLHAFGRLFNDDSLQHRLQEDLSRLQILLEQETARFDHVMGLLPPKAAAVVSRRLESLRDAAWGLDREILRNITKIRELAPWLKAPADSGVLGVIKHLNGVLNAIDRLEVRGRDSAGVSLMFVLERGVFQEFLKQLEQGGLVSAFDARRNPEVLLNNSISVAARENTAAIALTYKVAAEIGHLGDNIAFIRDQLKTDPVLRLLAALPHRHHTVSAHTRWASVGAITEANCHPVDNRTLPATADTEPVIHVCLNGDIDNYQELKADYEARGVFLPEAVTCDTKIIPVHIAGYLDKGHDIHEAFRLAVNDFHGSHAITMHTDLAPGKLFLALKGSGQALFIGLAPDHYVTASELYGLVEETSDFIKMDGEALNPSSLGAPVNGQIVILDQAQGGGLGGVRALSYDGAPIVLTPEKVRKTPLTSRDIDRQQFDHYFLKEISESPASVRKTLENRWKITGGSEPKMAIVLDNTQFPDAVASAFKQNRIRRIIFIGQGTAGVAALVCADILRHYLKETAIRVEAYKSSEMSGFILSEQAAGQWGDTLLVPISQSGTTADTNRAVDMMKKMGAFVIAVVNRRDSDLCFKADGVLYTSSGRDIEMSVASTKAFYSQIIAGAVLGLHVAQMGGRRNSTFISSEIKQMTELPALMEQVLARREEIKAAALRRANARTHWAAVGSGPNKAAADEIRIKLSELCYKTISSDYVEDKKHIDLSSEPLIVVCAAGARRTVLGDIIKDTAIFHSHKALTIVIADENEDRFAPYADEIIPVPSAAEHFAPILNTLAGHLWGYYAALAINEGSKFLYDFREDLNRAIFGFKKNRMDLYEIALEKSFREKILRFYQEFRKRQEENRLSGAIGVKASGDILLLLKYLSGKLPLADFELDFGEKGTAANMFNRLFGALNTAINTLARPVDAIKHQAKTVTVGTSRIEETAEGLVFNLIREKGFTIAQLTIANLMVVKNIQPIIRRVKGATLYGISGMGLLGEPDDATTLTVIEKTGTSAAIPSRAEADHRLTGTKRIIVQRGNVYIGRGRKDDRSILVIPLLSNNPEEPHAIAYLLLLDIDFETTASLKAKIRALGGKYEHIKNLVQETNASWRDDWLERVGMADLFGWSAEKVAEKLMKNDEG